MSLLPRRRPLLSGLLKAPLRPPAALAGSAANTMDAAAPFAAQVGDKLADASSEALQAGAEAVAPAAQMAISQGGNALGSAVSEIPGIGPVLGGGIKAGADALSAAAPMAMKAAAVPAAKVGGRILGSVAAQGLHGLSRLGGEDPMGPASRQAMNMRALSSTMPMEGLGGGAPPPPAMPSVEHAFDDSQGGMPDVGLPTSRNEMALGGVAGPTGLIAKQLMEAQQPKPVQPSFRGSEAQYDALNDEIIRRGNRPRVRTAFSD